MDYYKRSDPRSDQSDTDDRFHTPRVSARLGGSSSDGEWVRFEKRPFLLLLLHSTA